MRDLDNLKEMIVKHEGHEPRVYKCSNGFDTIGYGFAIKDLWFDKEICDFILDKKIKGILGRISADEDDWDTWFWDKPQGVKEVLVNMIYQMGFSGVRKFKKTIKYIREDKLLLAGEEMLDSKWARSDSPNRAKELSDIIKSL